MSKPDLDDAIKAIQKKNNEELGKLTPSEQEKIIKKANGGYQYRDEEMNLVGKARNHAKEYGYVELGNVMDGHPKINRTSGVLIKGPDAHIDSINKGSFVRNSLKGIVVECPAMAGTGEEASAVKDLLKYAVSDILTLGSHDDFNVYPAKIIFPFNPSHGHWIAGEIILNKEASGKFSAEIAQYNPMRNYSEQVYDKAFCDGFQKAFEEAAGKAGIKSDLEIKTHKAVNISKKRNGRMVPIQQGGVSCGVYSAYALDHLKKDDATTMWSNFPDDDHKATIQRINDAISVKKLVEAGKIVQKQYGDFGYKPVTIGKNNEEIKVSVSSLVEDFAKSVSSSLPKSPKDAEAKVTKLKAEKGLAEKIEEMDKLIAENRGDKEMLSAILLSLKDEGDEEINFVIKSNLISAGAQISEEMLAPLVASSGTDGSSMSIKNSMQDELNHEYFLRALHKETADKIEELFKKYNIYPQYCSIKDGSSILHHAVQNPSLDVVGNMIKSGANINAQDHCGYSPLMLAVIYDKRDVVKYLIEKGADVNLRNSEDLTALDLAKVFKDESKEGTEVADLIGKKVESTRSPVKPIPPRKVSSSPLSTTAAPPTPKRAAAAAVPKIPAEKPVRQVKMLSDVIIASEDNIYDRASQISQYKQIVRKELTIDRSDFFLTKEIEYAEGNLPRILITADDLSFQDCSENDVFKTDNRDQNRESLESSKEDTYIKLDGKYKDIFQPKIKNSSGAFQPYFANFGAIYFKEDGGKKIFNKANLFMANFRNCVFDGVDLTEIPKEILISMNFHKCIFINVDFSKMPIESLIGMKMFDDKFKECTFENCKFPHGISIQADNREFNVGDEILKLVDQFKVNASAMKLELNKNRQDIEHAKEAKKGLKDGDDMSEKIEKLAKERFDIFNRASQSKQEVMKNIAEKHPSSSARGCSAAVLPPASLRALGGVVA